MSDPFIPYYPGVGPTPPTPIDLNLDCYHYVTATDTLESLRTSASMAGKTAVITTTLTQAQSNLSGTWPTDRAIFVEMGGSIANSTAFTVAGPFDGTLHHIFTGAGAVTLACPQVYPQWFGAVADGLTDDTAAIAKAIDAAGRIYFKNGTYLCNINCTNKFRKTLVGESYNSILKAYTTDPIIWTLNTTAQETCLVVDTFFMLGNNTSDGLSIKATGGGIIHACEFKNLYIKQVSHGVITGGTFYGNKFKNIVVSVHAEEGFETNGGYIHFDSIFITGGAIGKYAVTTSGQMSHWNHLTTETTIKVSGRNNVFNNTAIEFLSGTSDFSSGRVAVEISGYSNTMNGLTLIYAKNKCGYGLNILNPGNEINNLIFYGNVPLYPVAFTHAITLNGCFISGYTDPFYKIDQYVSDTLINDSVLLRCEEIRQRYQRIRGRRTTSITNSAKTIYSVAPFGLTKKNSGLFLVQGVSTGDTTIGFTDLIILTGVNAANTVVAVSSNDIGAADARTYSISGTDLQLAVASGTYNIRMVGIDQSAVNE